MQINIKLIKEANPHIDIDVNSKNNILEFNNNSNITYVYGVNGSGKSSICTAFKNVDDEIKLCKEKVEVFSYDNDFVLDDEKIMINKNIRDIQLLENEAQSDFIKEIDCISKIFSELNIFNTNKTLKAFIFDDDAFLKQLCFTKTTKITDLDHHDYYELLHESNLEKASEYTNILKSDMKENAKYKELIKNEFSKKNFKIIEKLYELVGELQNDEKIIYEELIRNQIPNISINELSIITKFLQEYGWKNNECPICHNKVNLESIRTDFEKKYNDYRNKIEKIEKFKELNGLQEYLNSIECNTIREIAYEIPNLFDHGLFSSTLISLKNKLTAFFSTFDDMLKWVKLTIISSYFVNKKNEFKVNLEFFGKAEKYMLLNKQKVVFDKQSVELIESIINDSIGSSRLHINIEKGNVCIDEASDISDFHLSTGEKNLVIFAFSLLAYIKNANKESILMIDDPISSFDNNNKQNIVYLINYFANKFPDIFRCIIFTHNLDMLNTQFYSSLGRTMPKLYLLKDGKNSFFSDKQTGFIEITFDEIFFLSIKSIKKFISDRLENRTINIDFVEKNISSFVAMLPIIRTFLYINNIIDDKNEFHKMLHFNSDFSLLKNNENILYAFDIFFNFSGAQHAQSKCILNTIIDFFTKFNETDEINSDDKYDFFTNDLNNKNLSLINESLQRITNMLLIRIFVEKKLISATNNIDPCDEKWSLRRLIDNSNLSEQQKISLKCKRILISGYIHLENVSNLMLPGFDLSWRDEKNQINSIMKVFGRDVRNEN